MITAILLVAGIGFLFALVGIERFGSHLRSRNVSGGFSGTDEQRIGHVVTSIFGLLALLLGFTFSMAHDRFERRSADVVAEANAIGSAYQLAELVDVPGRTVLQSELRRYAELRLRFGEARGDIGTLQLASARGRQSIEAASLAVAQPIAATPLALAIMNSADQIGDRGVEREVTMQARLPTAVFAVLLLFMCVAVGVMGYAYPVSARRRQWASALLFSLLIITLLLIIDLDRPAGGSIVIEQDAMKDLVTNFRSNSVRP